MDADPHHRDLKHEAIIWEDEARKILGKIHDRDSDAKLKVKSADEAVKQALEMAAQKEEERKQAWEVAAQKDEELKQAFRVVEQKQEELKKCRIMAAATHHFGGQQGLAVMDDQEFRSMEACEKIDEALETLDIIDEAGQKEADDSASAVKEEA